MFPFGTTATRLRRHMIEDPYSGEPTLGDWSNPNRLPLVGVAFAPMTSEEAPEVDAETLSRMRQLLAPTDVDILADDRVEDEVGDVWDVVGEPSRYSHPMTGWQAGSVTRLRRVEEL